MSQSWFIFYSSSFENHTVKTGLWFYDQLQGDYVAPRSLAEEDFIIVRKDNLFAYNLVVVIDDHDQAITEVVRGADLIAPSVRQISLHHLLAFPVPDYMHLPLVLNRFHNKLSKQNHTPPLPINDPRPILIDALNFFIATNYY